MTRHPTAAILSATVVGWLHTSLSPSRGIKQVLVGCRFMIAWLLVWVAVALAAAVWLGSWTHLLLLLVGFVPLVFLFAFKKRPPVCPRCGGSMQIRALGALVPGLVCQVCGYVEPRTRLEG